MPESKGGLTAIFDLSFRRYATPTVARIVYVLAAAVAVLAWLGWTILLFAVGGAANSATSYYTGGDGGGGAFIILGVLSLLFGWIIALLQIIAVRLALEFVLASIRTAEDTAAIRERLSAGA